MSSRWPLARGDVVLVRFPFSDLSGQKLRPALVVGRPSGDDVMAAFMTTRMQPVDLRAEHVLQSADPEFRMTGLKTPSLVRLNRLATPHRSLVQRRLGRIGSRTEQAIARCLRYVFDL